MTSEYTGPIRPTKEAMEKWYHRFKDVCIMIRQRHQGLACHPNDKSFIIDHMDRLLEDETYSVDGLPPLVVTNRVKKGEFQAIDLQTAKVLTFAELNRSNTGFGRFKGLSAPGKEGLTAAWRVEGKKGQVRVLEPDAPGHKLDPI